MLYPANPITITQKHHILGGGNNTTADIDIGNNNIYIDNNITDDNDNGKQPIDTLFPPCFFGGWGIFLCIYLFIDFTSFKMKDVFFSPVFK